MKTAIVTDIAPLRQAVAEAHRRGRTIGLVPTMGALHAGHLSLIKAAREETGFVVVSIFVNPTQFGPNEDLNRYPRPLQRDLELCEKNGVDLVFHPQPAVIYPPDYHTFVEVKGLQEVLCGASRPGHFRGVATVVLKLFNLVQPDRAYFGQKDAQQVSIIRQMVRDLNVPVDIRVCPIIREADGLALSSRNEYLGPEERRSERGATADRGGRTRFGCGAAGDGGTNHIRAQRRPRLRCCRGRRLVAGPEPDRGRMSCSLGPCCSLRRHAVDR